MVKSEKKSENHYCSGKVSPLIKFLLLGLLVVKQTSIVIIARYCRTRAPNQELHDNANLILLTEAAKFLVNVILELCVDGGMKTFSNALNDPLDTLKVAIPAVLYFIQNFLTYVALENLIAPIFQVTYQGKLLFAAILSVNVLRHYYTTQQWCCLFFMSIGIAIVLLGEHSHDDDVNQNTVLGLTSVAIAGLCSASASIYFEIVVKEENSKATLFMRNIQLSFFSLIIATSSCFIRRKNAEKTFFHGFSTWAWILVLLQASGGLAVSLVLKYFDNVVRGLATGSSVILSAFLA